MLAKIKQMIHGRRHARVMADSAMPIKLVITALGKQYRTIVWDISEGGVGFKLPAMLPTSAIDTPVSISISLPYPEPKIVTVVAELRHITDYVHGVEFYDLEKETAKEIAAYVSYMSKNHAELVSWGEKPSGALRVMNK